MYKQYPALPKKDNFCIFTLKHHMSIFIMGIFLRASKRIKGVYFIKNNNYVLNALPK